MTHSRQLAPLIFSALIKKSFILALPVLLVSCGSGTETVQNPFLGGNPGTGIYTGPPPTGANAQKIKDFQDTVWTGLRAENRCGRCHDSDGGQTDFVNEADINLAFSSAESLMNETDPASSLLVTKVASGHNCWETFDSVCADTIENMISAWAGTGDNTTARVIQLTAPVIKDPGNSKNYPELPTDNAPNSFVDTVYPLLTQHCVACHYEEGITQQQNPFFANPDDSVSSYEAAKSKINIDTPAQSRLVSRLLEGHNCWSTCGTQDPVSGIITAGSNARAMLDEINTFANITPVQINPLLVTSKALTLLDGIIASGGNRHEADAIALYEFKTGTGNTAFDTSGVEPAMNLTLTGNVSWLGAYGLDFTGGKAQADTTTSKKLHDFIQSTGEYSIEAWTIPANVDQEDRSIIGYDVGAMQKNFSLSQTLYNYNFSNRSDQSDSKGDAFISSEDAGEILQSSLQHVVVTYSTINGRKIFVNGEALNVTDPVTDSSTISSWDPSYAFVLGQNANNEQSWTGKLRMVVIHNEVLTDAQVLQNFEVGVGQKYFLLFSIGDRIGVPNSYIRFEVSQFDSFSYLFENPTYINLDANWTPSSITIRNMRIGINGKEAVAGQSYANMNATIDGSYTAAEGQNLSRHGAVIALEKGSDSDEFFLTFEYLEGVTINQFAFNDPIPPAPADPPDAAAVSEIGVRTFDEINEAIARMTGIPVTNPAVNSLFQQYRQQLPTVESIDAFLSSHQMAIAQLALTSCSERVDADAAFATGSASRGMFTNFDFDLPASHATNPTAFDTQTKINNAIDPVISAVLSNNLNSQPDATEIKNLLGASTQQTLTWSTGTINGSINYDSLITEMTKCPAPTDPHFKVDFPCNVTTDINTVARTAQIVKAICAATVGSAAMLIQ